MRRRTRCRNHSRAGGTEEWLQHKAAQGEESLPRGRDGGDTGLPERCGHGITPARAGRRIRPLRWWSIEWNHSRAGGTEARPSGRTTARPESLPRGRDGGVIVRRKDDDDGITPARAGRRVHGRPE